MRTFQYKILFRNWAKKKIYPCISIFSLIVGLTCSTLLIGFAMNEDYTAHSTPDEGQVYAIQKKDAFYHDSDLKTYSTPQKIARELHDKYPEVTDYCTFRKEYVTMYREGRELDIKHSYKVTPGIVRIFRPRMIAGNLQQTLSHPTEVAITRSFALRTFGKENPSGETLTLRTYKDIWLQKYGVRQEEVKLDYTITSVIDDRQPGILNYELFIGFTPEEMNPPSEIYTSWFYSLIKLQAGSNISLLKEKINGDETLARLSFLPVQQVYYTKDYSETELFRFRDYNQLQTSLWIALLILAIACFNHVNINLTRSFQRLLYSGQQLIHGASKNEIRMQVIQETALQVIFAFGISLIIIYILLPTFNTFMGSRLIFQELFRGETSGTIFYTLAAVILLPSIYILFQIERIPLSDILRKNHTHRSSFVAGIIVVQFTISIILLVLFMTIKHQTKYITHIRPDSESIVSIQYNKSPDEHAWKIFKEKVITLPEVIDYTSTFPLNNGAIANREFNANTLKIDQRFFRFYQAELIAGDSLLNHSNNSGNNVIVNEALIRKKQIENPIGGTFDFDGTEYVIGGVIKDYVIDHVSNEIQPLLIIQDRDDWVNAQGTVIKTRTGETKATINKLQHLWQDIAPTESPLIFTTLADLYRQLHNEEFRTARIVSVFTWISMLLSSLGLFGLAWYSVECRTQEICLRKVSGATERQIVSLVCGRFIKWMLFSSILGIPVAWYLAQEWLSQFIYRTPLSPWIFITSILLVIAIGILTVIRQSWYAATLNPIDTLKTE